MSKLYMPLRILDQMGDQWKRTEKARDTAKNTNPAIKEFVNELMKARDSNDPKGNTLNLDDLISWAISGMFMKRSYEGPYADINKILLQIWKHNQEKGVNYKTCRKQYRDTISFATVFQCWAQYKQAYRFDADFVDELMKTSTIETPVDILKRLPFRCFYLDLEDIPRFGSLSGIFAYIGFDESTGLPNIGLYLVSEPDIGEKVKIHAYYTFGPDMQKAGMLFKNDKGETCLRFTNDTELLKVQSDFESKDAFDLMFFALQAMLYLSSNKPDTAKSPKRKYVNTGKKKASQAPTQDLEITDVGVRYGAAIRKIKKQASQEEDTVTTVHTTNAKPRKPMASHVRSAHWHHYWVGKGRQKQIVKWVSPTFVSGLGKEMPVVIHNVKGN